MKKILIVFLLLFPIYLFGQTIHYVKPNGVGDGSSWANASNDLQSIINSSASEDEIWVSAGTYLPLVGHAFELKDSVKVYGGFSGTETTLAQRNWQIYTTILAGNGNSVVSNDPDGTNITTLTYETVLDGFTISGGSYTEMGGGIHIENSRPTLRNLIVKDNYSDVGGGIGCTYCQDIYFKNIQFQNNHSTGNGGAYYGAWDNSHFDSCFFTGNTLGAISLYKGNITLSNCNFVGNFGDGIVGGGIGAVDCDTVLIDRCMFDNNTCGSGGSGGADLEVKDYHISNTVFENNTAAAVGGLHILVNHNDTSDLAIVNCIFANNRSTDGGAGAVQLSGFLPPGYALTISNSTFYNNAVAADYAHSYTELDCSLPVVVYNCIIDNNIGGHLTTLDDHSSNFYFSYMLTSFDSEDMGVYGQYSHVFINQDPKFVDAQNGNFGLGDSSLAFDAGNNSLYDGYLNTDKDILEQPRKYDCAVDLGAIEHQSHETMQIVNCCGTIAGDSAFQWIDCNTNLPIPNATDRNYIPTQSGSYKLAITWAGGCKDTTSCVDYVFTGIKVIEVGKKLSLTPNPSKDFITLTTNSSEIIKDIIVLNASGTFLSELKPDSSSYKMDLRNFASGFYLLKITTNKGAYSEKIIKL